MTKQSSSAHAEPWGRSHPLLSAASILSFLADRYMESGAASADDYQWLSGAGEIVSLMATNVSDTVGGIASLVGSNQDAGAFQDKQDLAALLYHVADVASIVAALTDLGINASCHVRMASGESGDSAPAAEAQP
jgi:hypothetical protein